MEVFIPVLLLLVGSTAAHDSHSHDSHPHDSSCNETEVGVRQSPIDLKTGIVGTTLSPPLTFGRSYFDLPTNMQVYTDDHSVVVVTKHKSNPPLLHGGPLQDVYKIHSIHFHWGSKNNQGSEHTVNGHAYPMEMHVVHTKGNLTFEEAKKIGDGICVIGYFVEIQHHPICRSRNVDAFDILTNSIANLTQMSVKHHMQKLFPLKNLVVPFRYEYISYFGSLTTEPYSEAVIWILAPYTVKISQKQLDKFRSLYSKGLVEHNDNFRPTQPLNGRHIFFSRSPHPAYQHYIDNMLYKPFYTDNYCNYDYVNIYKPLLFPDPSFDYNNPFNKKPQPFTIPLDIKHTYYFDDNINLLNSKEPFNVEIVHYGDTNFPLVYNENKLTYGIDINGLIGNNHIPIPKVFEPPQSFNSFDQDWEHIEESARGKLKNFEEDDNQDKYNDDAEDVI